MNSSLGITQQGLDTALEVKEHYRHGRPLCLRDDGDRMLLPEYLLNPDLELRGYDDPLPLAMVAARDPEPPMALAAAARLSPLAGGARLIGGVYGVLGETTRHDLVRQCVSLVTDAAFDPAAIARVRAHAERIVVHTRREYTLALRRNLQSLMDGGIAPRRFVREFFQLTEAGNMRHDIRRRLIISLLLSPAIRPSTKFLMLENFYRMPRPVRVGIISALLRAEPTRHIEIMKEELRWVIQQERLAREAH